MLVYFGKRALFLFGPEQPRARTTLAFLSSAAASIAISYRCHLHRQPRPSAVCFSHLASRCFLCALSSRLQVDTSTVPRQQSRLPLQLLPQTTPVHALVHLNMTGTSVQDRTPEFRSILSQAQKRLASNKVGAQRQALLSDSQRQQANGSAAPGQGKRVARSEFARKAAEIGRGITSTTAKLQRLAECRCQTVLVRLRGHELTNRSGKTKDAIRRPTSRNLRVDIRD